MSWGIDVPNDPDHVMYVWFDALANYITTLGWPDNVQEFHQFWIHGTPIQYAGQDNLRQQSAMWQAMLMAANIPTSHQIHINGFIIGSDGRKMSKSLGNVVDPLPLVSYYGTDAVRYYLLHYIHPHDGSPVGYESIYQRYTSDLVNGIGNLTSRLLTLSEKYIEESVIISGQKLPTEWLSHFENFRMDLACDIVMKTVSELDLAITTTEPFKLIKTAPEEAKKLITEYIQKLYVIASMLEPIMPKTGMIIKQLISENKKPAQSLFPRLEIFIPDSL
jgi:methionyl-tRNA synthetase